MKKLLLLCSLLWPVLASAQLNPFVPGQILSAAELNTAFSLYAPLTGATFTGPVAVPTLTVTGTFTLPYQAANTLLGNSTGSSASPTAVAVSNCSGASSALNYTGGSGFSCNASINAITLGGATFSSPGPIGSVSTSTGAFSSVSTPSATIGGGTINATSVGSTSASTGAFSTLSASGTVSGAGFTSLFAAPPPLGATTPTAAALTTLVMSSTITPSQTAGIVGTTTNNNANAGSVGEYITATGTSVPLTTNVPANVTSISLTAGDWDVTGNIYFTPASGTVIANEVSGISTVSATFPAIPGFSFSSLAVAANQDISLIPPQTRISIASTTTVYLVAQSSFTVSTLAVTGFISARRRR